MPNENDPYLDGMIPVFCGSYAKCMEIEQKLEELKVDFTHPPLEGMEEEYQKLCEEANDEYLALLERHHLIVTRMSRLITKVRENFFDRGVFRTPEPKEEKTVQQELEL